MPPHVPACHQAFLQAWLHSVSHIKPSLRSLLLVGFVTAAREEIKMSPLSPLGIPQGSLPGLEGLGWLKHAVSDVWTWPLSSGLGGHVSTFLGCPVRNRGHPRSLFQVPP